MYGKFAQLPNYFKFVQLPNYFKFALCSQSWPNLGSDDLRQLVYTRPCAPLLPWSLVCENCSPGSPLSTVSLGGMAHNAGTGNVSPFAVCEDHWWNAHQWSSRDSATCDFTAQSSCATSARALAFAHDWVESPRPSVRGNKSDVSTWPLITL
jgi:hypothetical protein